MTVIRLRHVADVNPPSPAFERLGGDDEVTFLPMEAVWPGGRLDISQRRRKSEVSTGYTRFQDGDVLIPKITPTFEAARSVLVEGLHNGAGAGTTELHVLRAGPQISRRFLLHLVNTHNFLKLGEAEMYGVAGQKRVPDEFIRNFSFHLPPLEEQHRIAEFLDAEVGRIDRIITLRNQQLKLLSSRTQTCRDALVDRLTAKHGHVPLRRYCIGIEQGSSPQCEATPASPGEWGVLKLSSIRNGTFLPHENKRLPKSEDPVYKHEVKSGDLLITRANTPELVGDVAVVPDGVRRLLLPDLIYRVRLSGEAHPEYIAQVALSSRVRSIIQAQARGSSQSMVKLRGEDISGWPIPPLDAPQQRIFVNEIQRITGETERASLAIKRKKHLLRERKQALITAAVTGQIDVTTARGVGVS